MKRNPGLPLQGGFHREEDPFHQQIGLKFQDESSEMLHLASNFVWCCALDSSETRSEIY